MESLFINLIELLKLQNNTVKALLDASEKHNQAMQQNDASAMLAVVKKQESLAALLTQQDKKREMVQDQIAKLLGIEGRPNLSQLLEQTPESEAKTELIQISDQIKENLTQLDDLNRLNNVLAKRGLIFAQQLRNLIQPKEGNTYQGTGEIKNQDKPVSMIDKTI